MSSPTPIDKQNGAPTILVIDDEAAHRMLIKRAIKAFYPNAQIVEAENLLTARKVYTEVSPSAITLDLNLGGESGFEFLKWLRSNSETTPVIVVTTSQLPSDIRLAQQLGANHYVTKNSDIAINSQNIQSALQQALK